MFSGRSRSQGEPKQIITKNKTGSFEIVSKAVKSLLQDDKVKDKKVCVISVAGAFRKGKSFLLNFFVKYLEKACERTENLDNWLGSDNDKIDGFAWRGGSERKTTGIWAWSKVFILKKTGETGGTDVDTGRSTNEEIAVVLLDTQGTFDSEAATNESIAVFALGALISSTLVFNLSQNIQEDDLQHLQLFAEYGQLARKQTTAGKPFQTLMFLVRDWPYPGEYAYGSGGGKKFLARKLKTSGRHSDLKDVREGIQECFEQLHCCLLPYPGSKVATNLGSTCKLADLEENFKTEVKKFVESIASFKHLVKKEVYGQELTCEKLVNFIETHIKAFQGERAPSAGTLLQITAKAQHLTALDDARKQFSESIKQVCGEEVPYKDPKVLDPKLEDIKLDAEETYKDYPKVGSQAMNEEYLEKLSDFIMETCDEYRQKNSEKANIFRKTMTRISYYISYMSETTDDKADLESAKTQFMKDIGKKCGPQVEYMDPDKFDRILEDIRSKAEKTFKNYPKVRSQAMNKKCLEELSDFMMEKCEEYKRMNRNKANIFMKAMALITYVFSSLLSVATLAKIQQWFLHTIVTFYSFVSSTFHFLWKLMSGISTWSKNTIRYIFKRMINGMWNLLQSLLAPFAPIFIGVIFSILLYLVFGWFGPSGVLYCVIMTVFIVLCLWIFRTCIGRYPARRRTMNAFIWNPLPQAWQHRRR